MNIRDRITARGIFTVVLLVEIGIMLALSLGAFDVESPATINNTLLSVILGTVSVYLLYSQVDIQRNQVSIEEKLLKYETEPSLVVVDRWFERDDLYLEVANYGHGIAEDLKVECIVECPEIDWYQAAPSYTSLKRYDDHKEQILEDNSIRPQEEPVTFVGKGITVGRRVNGEESDIDESGFETLMRELIRDGTGEVVIRLRIHGHSIVADGSLIDEEAGESMHVKLSSLPDTANLSTVERYQN